MLQLLSAAILISHARSRMKQYQSAKQLKAQVRGALLGHYNVLVFSYLLMQFITSLALDFVQGQVSSVAGEFMYLGVYLLVMLLTGVFIIGQYYMYRKLLDGEQIAISDMWFGFRYHPDKAILITFITFLLCGITSLPFGICFVLFAKGGQAPVMFMLSMIFLAVFLIATLYISLCLSQAYFLLLDYPDETAIELCKHSNALMRGHKFRLFLIYMSFIGMFLLTLLTFGLGLLWVYPYFTGVKASFYDELVAESIDLQV